MAIMTRELERGLVEAGVSPKQAERIAVGLDERLSELSTKQDLRDLKHDLERQVDKLERTMWRVFLGLSTMMLAMFGAVFGALMYAVFG